MRRRIASMPPSRRCPRPANAARPCQSRSRAGPKAPWQVWRDAAGRLSPLRMVALAVPVRAGRDRDLRLHHRGLRRAPAQRRDPPHRLLGADLPDDFACGDAAAAGRALQPARRRAPHDRRRRLRLRRRPHLALCRRPDVRSLEGRKRNRAAALSDDRLCRAARPCGAGGDLDRRHGAPARRQALAAAAFGRSTPSACWR